MLSSQAVALENQSLWGDWLLPEVVPHCVALIWPGSGPTDSNGNQPDFEFNNLRDLALALAEHGVASLRVDKRGVGRSAAAIGDESQLTLETYVEDAVQWIRWLHTWGDADAQLPHEPQHLLSAQAHHLIFGMDHAMRKVSNSKQLHPDVIPVMQAFGML